MSDGVQNPRGNYRVTKLRKQRSRTESTNGTCSPSASLPSPLSPRPLHNGLPRMQSFAIAVIPTAKFLPFHSSAQRQRPSMSSHRRPPARPPTPLRSSRYAGAFVLPLSPCSSAKSNPIHFDFPPRAASQSFLLRRLSLIGEDLLRHSLCSCRTKVFSFALMIITALYRNGISFNQSTAFIRSS